MHSSTSTLEDVFSLLSQLAFPNSESLLDNLSESSITSFEQWMQSGTNNTVEELQSLLCKLSSQEYHSLWTELLQRGLNVSTLLGFFLHMSVSGSTSCKQVVPAHSVLGASCYLSLLALPRCPLTLRNDTLLLNSFTLLIQWAKAARGGHNLAQLIKKKERKAKKNQKKNTNRCMVYEDEDMQVEQEEDDAPLKHIPAHTDHIEFLISAAETLLLSSFHLEVDEIEALLEAAVEVTSTQDNPIPSNIVSVAWRIMTRICTDYSHDLDTKCQHVDDAQEDQNDDKMGSDSTALEPPSNHLLFRKCLSLLMSNVLLKTSSSISLPSPSKSSLYVLNYTLDWISSQCDVTISPATSQKRKAFVLDFVQHACIRMPERSDYHQHIVPAVAKLASLCSSERWLAFLQRASQNPKTHIRAVSVELAAHWLDNSSAETASVQHMLTLMFSRASDRIATIRAKSLQEIARVVEKSVQNEKLQQTLLDVLSSTYQDENIPATSIAEPDFPKHKHSARSSLLCTPSSRSSFSADALYLYTPASRLSLASFGVSDELCGLVPLLKLVAKRATDSKTAVRKNALSLLSSLLCFSRDGRNVFMPVFRGCDLQPLYDGCSDASVLIRKHSLMQVNAVLHVYPNDQIVQKLWLGCVAPLVEDCDSGIQVKALDSLNLVLLQNCDYSLCSSESEPHWVWSLIKSADSEVLALLRRGLYKLFQQNAQSHHFCNNLNAALPLSATNSAKDNGVWWLAEIISAAQPESIDVRALKDWCRFIQSADRIGSVLRVLANVGERAPVAFRSSVCALLKNEIGTSLSSREGMSPSLLKLVVQTIVALHPPAEQHSCLSWQALVLSECESILERFVHQQVFVDDCFVSRALFLVGEIVLLTRCKAKANLVTLGQAFLPQSLSPQLSATPHLATSKALSSLVRAHAFLAVGKMSLCDESLAKPMMSLFVKELSSSDDFAVRNNVLLVLSDLCRTFTALVDPHVMTISSSLLDINALIRKHTLVLLMQLLVQEYIKLRPHLYLRLMSVRCDPCEAISSLAHSLLKPFTQTHFKVHSHFVEAIFFYNACGSHPHYVSCSDNSFTLSSAQRRHLLVEWLQDMSNEQKLSVQAKMCEEVLSSIVSRTMPLISNSAQQVLSDTLYLLNHDSSKIKTTKRVIVEGLEILEDDEDRQREDPLRAAKGRLLGHIAKRSLLEAIVPVCMQLKRVLHLARSPLLRDLLDYMRTVWEEHHDEMTEVLSQDRQLAVEFEYDMRQNSEAKRMTMRETRELNEHRQFLHAGAMSESEPRSPMSIARKLTDANSLAQTNATSSARRIKSNTRVSNNSTVEGSTSSTKSSRNNIRASMMLSHDSENEDPIVVDLSIANFPARSSQTWQLDTNKILSSAKMSSQANCSSDDAPQRVLRKRRAAQCTGE